MRSTPGAPTGLKAFILFIGIALIGAVLYFTLFSGRQPTAFEPTAQEQLYIEQNPVLRVAIAQGLVPMQFLDGQGLPTGMATEYMEQISLITGIEFQYMAGTWAGGIERLKAGVVDIVPDATPNPSRRKYFDFSSPFTSYSTSIYVRDETDDIRRLEDLAGHRVGAYKGTAVIDIVRQYPDIEIIELPGSKPLLTALLDKSVDAVVGYDRSFQYQIFLNGTSTVRAVGDPISQDTGCLMIRKGNPTLLSILNKARNAIPDDRLSRIEDKWLAGHAYSPRLSFLIAQNMHWVWIALGIAVCLVAWVVLLRREVARRVTTIRENEARYKTLFESAHDAILIVKGDVVVDVNPSCLEMLQATREELIGFTPYNLAPEFQSEGQLSKSIAIEKLRLAQSGQPQTFGWLHTTQSGQELHLEVTLNAFETSQGTFVMSLVRDRTKQKQAQAEGRRQQLYLQQLFDGSPLAMALLDFNGLILNINPAFEALFGFNLREIKGRMLQDVIVPDDLRPQSLANNPVIKSGATVRMETHRQRKDGTKVLTSLLIHPVRIDDELAGVYAIYTDITQRKEAETELKRQKTYFQALFENSPQAIALTDNEAFITQVNRSFEQLFGYSQSEATGHYIHDLIVPEDQREETIRQTYRIRDGEWFQAEVLRQHKDGTNIQASVLAFPIYDEAHQLIGACINYSDITQRKEHEAHILRQQAHMEQLFDKSPQGIAQLGLDASIVQINASFSRIFGYEPEEVIGKNLDEFLVPQGSKELHASHLKSVSQGETIIFEAERRHKNGRMINLEVIAYPIQSDGDLLGAYVIYSDITERKKAEAQLIHHAYHDRLTGLPNRAKLMDHIGRAMARARRSPEKTFALIYIDLDRFKVINDSLGHVVGDQLIMAVAHRLQQTLREVDTLCRVGGDEFAILLEGSPTEEMAAGAVHRAQAAIRRPVTTSEHEIRTTSSVGLVMGPPGYDRPDFMLRDAEVAMHEAKEQGKDLLVTFQPSMHDKVMDQLHLENDLRMALERSEFFMNYQPVMDLKTGRVSGFEALIRWQHPDKGLIMPGDFIPMAEETGLIIPIGQFVLEQACTHFKQWKLTHPTLEHISVNLSARQFAQVGLASIINEVLTATDLPPEILRLEITESVIMENAHKANLLLADLKALGVGLSIDDFGTGYSSLSYLHSFPMDTLKVDRSFVSRMSASVEHEEIVRTIIQLAHNLNMNVVAEGVEHDTQINLLRRMRCDGVQGYLFSRPLPEDKVLPFLESRKD